MPPSSLRFPAERSHPDRRAAPPTSIYLMSDDAPQMSKLHCMYCTRIIADVKGRIDQIVSTPQTVVDFGLAVNIMCKLCRQQYRLLIAAR